MHLKDYLQQRRMSVALFAEKGNFCRATVYNWLNGNFLPDANSLKKISKITNGKVTPDDFDAKKIRVSNA